MRKTTIYDGKNVRLDEYSLTIEGRKARREIVKHPGAAAILAFDEKGKIILVRQHRFPRGYILEIPAGTLEKGESPKRWALREIQEETGYKAGNDASNHILSFDRIQYGGNPLFCSVRD